MTVTVNEILELFSKAQKYDVKYGIYPRVINDYEIQLEDGKSIFTFHITDGEFTPTSDFKTIDQVINHMDKQFKERTEEQKRKAILERLLMDRERRALRY